MIAIYLLIPISVILGVLSGTFNLKIKPVYRILFKGLASLSFIAIALIATSLKGTFNLYSVLVIGALILGTVGDLYLCMNKDLAQPNHAPYLFLIGGACFFGGHILFAISYAVQAPLKLYLLPCILILPALLGVALLVGRKKINLGKFTPFAFIYGVILNLMLVVTVNAFVANQNLFGILSLVAGILFVTSDGSLFFKEFSHLKGNPVLIYTVLLTYYVAQCLFAYTILLV